MEEKESLRFRLRWAAKHVGEAMVRQGARFDLQKETSCHSGGWGGRLLVREFPFKSMVFPFGTALAGIERYCLSAVTDNEHWRPGRS
jgi:hypothetical protein